MLSLLAGMSTRSRAHAQADAGEVSSRPNTILEDTDDEEDDGAVGPPRGGHRHSTPSGSLAREGRTPEPTASRRRSQRVDSLRVAQRVSIPSSS